MTPARGKGRRHARWWTARWVTWAGLGVGLPLILFCGALGYYYVTFARQIDARLHGERARVLPRIYARPLSLWRGQAMTEPQLIERLNDLGYAERTNAGKPGEFAVGPTAVDVVPREGEARGRVVRVLFQWPTRTRPGAPPPKPRRAERVERLEVNQVSKESVRLDAPMLAALITDTREKRRQVPLDAIPTRVSQAVLAIEDRRFYDHPGVDVIRTVGAIVTNLRGDRTYLVGGSTLTQQLVKNFFLTPEKSIRRKLLEQFMALILERRASKDELLELYLNEVYLGQRGSFAIHGVAEGARLFFAKDVSNLSLAEAATLAGIIQSPYNLSPFSAPERARDRRNVVLQAMADAGFVSPAAAAQAATEPLTVVARALEAEAPYFVDMIGQTLAEQYPGLTSGALPLDVYTTLDLNLQRTAQDAVRSGLTRVDQLLSRRRRQRQPAQAALIAVDPRSGEILALVGGRSYNQSQFNRALNARRQPGSVFKPFVYLAAFERALADGRTDLTPATLVDDVPTTFTFGEEEWTPENYENEYDGLITLRQALAHSRNIATVKVAETTGYSEVAGLWKRLGIGTAPRAFPSIALGVFEATPYEIASAYTIFVNGGARRVLKPLQRIVHAGEDIPVPTDAAPRPVARPDTTYLVTSMMRSVMDEGTGAGARSAGFRLDAAGKTGTTNDLRDAWFVGFTPELLTVVWVGLDNNEPLGLSGSQAALPIWTSFMTRGLAGQPDVPFEVPDGVSFVDIDRDTGKLAAPGCPRVYREAFLAGTEPIDTCDLHRW